jgi:acetoin utilization deacetylase AcuC-like enzyme
MARHVRDLAAQLGVPLGAVLEGGYEPAALTECVQETLTALGGDEPPRSAAPNALLTSLLRERPSLGLGGRGPCPRPE